MMAPTPTLPAALEGLIAGLTGASAGLSPLAALAAIVAGGGLYLAASDATAITSAARQALSLAAGGAGALGLAHALAALSALLGPAVVAR